MGPVDRTARACPHFFERTPLMPDYGDYTLTQVQAAIQPGQPATMSEAGRVFAGVLADLRALSTEIPVEVGAVTTGDRAWTGPAAAALVAVVNGLVEFLDRVAQPLEPYGPALAGSGAALSTAQADLAQFSEEVAAYRAQMTAIGVISDDASIDAEARKILVILALAYQEAVLKLHPIPTSPQDATSVPGQRSEPRPRSGVQLPQLPAEPVLSLPDVSPLARAAFLAPGPMSVPTLGVHLGFPDPSTLLASYTGPVVTAPAVSGIPVGAMPEPLPGSGPLAGNGPSSPVTTMAGSVAVTGRASGPGAGSLGGSVAPQGLTTGPASLPSTLFAGPGDRRPGDRSPGFGPVLGRPEEEDDRQPGLPFVGDEDWTDDIGLTGAIGRTPPPRSGE
ncbi:hypothetical protein ABT346_04060 [Micromonospora peucetia]|uniref:hypothetical protein n=1 Tax=Micromonospora peucetia TaxID=47871 RepID=UPI00333329CF